MSEGSPRIGTQGRARTNLRRLPRPEVPFNQGWYSFAMTRKPGRNAATNHPTLFEMEKTATAPAAAIKAAAERICEAPGLLLGTSSFTASGWSGTLYPEGLKPADSSHTTRVSSGVLRSIAHITPHRPRQR
jgi:hypothetical protein